ncbi:hypothetical protein VNI00_018116 [Paramarasmius palmivorus]|uniref:Uncharacterized protein n=1 Tax=Paramarasmius palmivorus TaxID=297713 RepID=A0AAW0B1H8_9AGAR
MAELQQIRLHREALGREKTRVSLARERPGHTAAGPDSPPGDDLAPESPKVDDLSASEERMVTVFTDPLGQKCMGLSSEPTGRDRPSPCDTREHKRHQQASNSRRYYQNHRSEIRLRVKERRARQAEILRSSSEEIRNDILEAKRRKQREYSRKHREANRSAINARERERRKRQRDLKEVV